MKKGRVYLVFALIIVAILLVRKYDKQNRDEKDRDRVYNLTKQRLSKEQQQNETVDDLLDFSKIDNVFGNKESPIKIIEFSRFSCSFCVKFHNEIADKFKKNYVDAGKVAYTSRLIIDKDTLLGVVLPACIDDVNEKYEIIRQLYLRNEEWLPLEEKEKVGKLKEIWMEVVKSKSEDDFNNCIVNLSIGNTLLKQQNKDREEFNINVTPTFIINGKKYENYYEYEDFIKLFDNE
ncbi:MAG: DsbA family protein [Rickettsiales bacterium]|jgi:protein-disulfide isomerase|nr:DsbA family protein [Rickettsiales bacterium]